MCNTRQSGGTESKKNVNVRYRYALAFDRGSSHVLTVSTMVLIDDIILLVPNMALIEAHSSSTHLFMLFIHTIIWSCLVWRSYLMGKSG